MPVPAISPLTSILAPFVGENFLYQPAATNSPTRWEENERLFAFTVNTTTNLLTIAGAVLTEGMRVRILSRGYGTGTLTSDNTNVSNGDTVTIGSKVYTFKTTLTSTEGEVKIGASADASLLNLINAINHTGTAGTDYYCAEAHPEVTAATSVTAHAFAITAIVAGIAYQTLEASTHLSWGAAALTGAIGTLPAPFAEGPWYYLRDVDNSAGTAKVVATKNGLISYPERTITGGVEATNVITTDGAHNLHVGDRVNFPTLTGGSGLTAASAFYYVATVPTASTFTVSATLGGSDVDFTTDITAGTVQRTDIIDITTAGTGTFYIQVSALPEGLALDPSIGTVEGIPENDGFFQITLRAANASGYSADFIFPIGVRPSPTLLLDTAIGLQWDWDSGFVSLVGGKSSEDPDKPLLRFKNGDQLVFAVQFLKSDKAFQPDLQYLYAAVKIEDEETQIVLSAGGVTVRGVGEDAWFYFIVDTTTQDSAVKASLDDIAQDGNDQAKAWMELRLAFSADPLMTGTPSSFNRASRSIPVFVERSLIAA